MCGLPIATLTGTANLLSANPFGLFTRPPEPLVTAWVDLESMMLSKISQSEKDKYHVIAGNGFTLANSSGVSTREVLQISVQ